MFFTASAFIRTINQGIGADLLLRISDFNPSLSFENLEEDVYGSHVPLEFFSRL